MKTYDELKAMFLLANKKFLIEDIDLLDSMVSERALCGALMIHLNRLMVKDKSLEGYYTDVEYNRNRGNIKTIQKTILGPEAKIINVTCDLIMHSRGNHIEQDNLIAIEMKKSNAPEEEKQKDKDRLKALTKDSFDDVWSFDGTTLPEHVCRYIIGIYYEIDFSKRKIFLEYYKQGELLEKQTLNVGGFFLRSKNFGVHVGVQ